MKRTGTNIRTIGNKQSGAFETIRGHLGWGNMGHKEFEEIFDKQVKKLKAIWANPFRIIRDCTIGGYVVQVENLGPNA